MTPEQAEAMKRLTQRAADAGTAFKSVGVEAADLRTVLAMVRSDGDVDPAEPSAETPLEMAKRTIERLMVVGNLHQVDMEDANDTLAAVRFALETSGRLEPPDATAGQREMCETCQGNGEVVTDWDQYLGVKPDESDEDDDRQGEAPVRGDEGTAECPDCTGTGFREGGARAEENPSAELLAQYDEPDSINVTIEGWQERLAEILAKETVSTERYASDVRVFIQTLEIMRDGILSAVAPRSHPVGVGWMCPYSGETYTAGQLAEMLDGRDRFLVQRDVFSEFVDWITGGEPELPSAPPPWRPIGFNLPVRLDGHYLHVDRPEGTRLLCSCQSPEDAHEIAAAINAWGDR